MTTAQELTLPKGIPGFPDLTSATLTPIDDEDLPGVYAELCDTTSDVSFLLARPGVFFPDYVITVDDATTATVGDDPDAVEVWVLLTHDGARFLANLRGPLLVNRAKAVAVQAVLDDPELPERAALV